MWFIVFVSSVQSFVRFYVTPEEAKTSLRLQLGLQPDAAE